MPNIIHVIKPFMFSYPAKEGQRLAKEKLFTVGDHEVDDEVYTHPYISEQFAEGKIERPEQTKKRIDTQTAKVEDDDRKAIAATALANAAFARLKAAEPGAKASKEQIEKELNTPVSELKTVQGAEIGAPVNTLKLKGQKA